MSFLTKLQSKMHKVAFSIFPLYVSAPPLGDKQRLRGSIQRVHQLVAGSLPENAIEELAAIAVNNFQLETPVKTISYRGFQDETDSPLKNLERYVAQLCSHKSNTIALMKPKDVESLKKAVIDAINLQASITRRKDPSTIRVVVFRFEIGKDIFNILSIFQNDTPIHTYRAVQHYQQPG